MDAKKWLIVLVLVVLTFLVACEERLEKNEMGHVVTDKILTGAQPPCFQGTKSLYTTGIYI